MVITDTSYIRDSLIPVLPLWAYCFCEHSPILLQVSTTNPVESWHSTLKTKGIKKDTLQQFSLCGITKHVLAVAKQWDLRSEEAHRKWCAYLHPISKEFPEISGFPSPIQTRGGEASSYGGGSSKGSSLNP
jgi:hypothetical protein